MTQVPFKSTRKSTGIFAYSNWDAIPVFLGVAHLGFVVWFVAGFGGRGWWENILLGFAYAYLITWNINSVSHNFIHTPYFRAAWANYAFALLESLAIGFSQTFYRWVHMRHHVGNSDRPDANGETKDLLSIYRYGKDGEPEDPWSYTFKSFFRDDPGDIFAALKQRKPFDAYWGRFEIGCVVAFAIAALVWDWRAVLTLAPFYYLGNSLSSLNGYYEHFRGDPDKPIAWGVSTYAPIYNLLWLNNGYHAEHHFRPSIHWLELKRMHAVIAVAQAQAGVHVIRTAHAFGFLAAENRSAASRQQQWGRS